MTRELRYSTHKTRQVTSVFTPKDHKVIAIACSDIHLSHIPPISRSSESDWYAAMARPLKQLCKLQERYDVPIICAGDILHKWNVPNELVNFALDHLPIMYAVPGQHDLPNHNYEDIKRSAFWTLCKAGKVNLVDGAKTIPDSNLCLFGFPWGRKIQAVKPHSLVISIAIIHKYIWTKNTGYIGAPKDSRLKTYKNCLKGYDFAIFGDNHIPFCIKKWDTTILNCGSLMRRNIDQLNYKPNVWLLKSDNTIEGVPLKIGKDKLMDTRQLASVSINGQNIAKVLSTLRGLKDCHISFEEAVNRYLNQHKVTPEVRKLIISAMED